MKKGLASILLFAFLILFFSKTYAVQGFQSSNEKNVFNFRGSINGATASLIVLPSGEKVLSTQAHVVDAFPRDTKLTWGKFYGWGFKDWYSEPEAFELEFTPEVLWKDDELDIAFLRVPSGLEDLCKCDGLKTAPYREGKSYMIGYPQTGMRTHPFVGQPWKSMGTIFGTVEQKISVGKTWREANEIVADIDGLPGNSGSSIFDENGDVIGMLHLLKSWYGEGYKYKVPSINLLSIEYLVEKYEEHKRTWTQSVRSI